jgi:sugar phosphate isomerase/epimerase
MSHNIINRRKFLAATAASFVSARYATKSVASQLTANPVCVFTKPFQSMSYDELAEQISKLGFDGIEAPIRDGGHIEPKQVPDELPKMVEALKSKNLVVSVMTSSINDAQSPLTESVLRTAASLGIKRYRMKYLRYSKTKPIKTQLKEWNKQLKDLAAINKELGIRAVYQNHAGNSMLGASIWDLDQALDGISKTEIGVAYDIRHATVEGGQSWPTTFRLIQPRIDTVYAKDFVWQNGKPQNVPLGTGQIDLKFFKMLAATNFKGPISLHEEYLDHRNPKLVRDHLAAIKTDFATLKKSLVAK